VSSRGSSEMARIGEAYVQHWTIVDCRLMMNESAIHSLADEDDTIKYVLYKSTLLPY
jgi:hypothetical protein